eukprot:TRINITY_DN12744_c0_g3_i1.p1 TRINITY_DN12744_c0_g3~~TRINITY_DN12744_c0_g3_i1.p1  ORF type:complete len:152 (-),score=29.99 TRINITY_DN12744_c0_g3_i1:90-545(-)
MLPVQTVENYTQVIQQTVVTQQKKQATETREQASKQGKNSDQAKAATDTAGKSRQQDQLKVVACKHYSLMLECVFSIADRRTKKAKQERKQEQQQQRQKQKQRQKRQQQSRQSDRSTETENRDKTAREISATTCRCKRACDEKSCGVNGLQ